MSVAPPLPLGHSIVAKIKPPLTRAKEEYHVGAALVRAHISMESCYTKVSGSRERLDAEEEHQGETRAVGTQRERGRDSIVTAIKSDGGTLSTPWNTNSCESLWQCSGHDCHLMGSCQQADRGRAKSRRTIHNWSGERTRALFPYCFQEKLTHLDASVYAGD